MSAIEWIREPRRILLPVLILPPFPVTDLSGADARALIDTGSTVSGLTTRLASTLSLTRLSKGPLKSAHGDGQVNRLAFRVGLYPDLDASGPPGFPFVFEEVIGIELTHPFEFDALIGMDILRHCDFDMRRDGWCRLRFGT